MSYALIHKNNIITLIFNKKVGCRNLLKSDRIIPVNPAFQSYNNTLFNAQKQTARNINTLNHNRIDS